MTTDTTLRETSRKRRPGRAAFARGPDRRYLARDQRRVALPCSTDHERPRSTPARSSIGRPSAQGLAWQALQAHAAQLSRKHLRDLFAADGTGRFDATSVQALDLLYDFSRQRVTRETLNLLQALAEVCDLPARIAALFAGEPVNNTEGRAAMHMALRNRSDRPMLANGQDVMPEVRAQLARMREFVTGVHQGRILGFTGARFTDVVNIGIGGSDLGIAMATEALARFRNKGIRLHCVSNVDGVELADALEQVNPATTLFVICSKTFTTQETLANANAAREWLIGELGEKGIAHHFVAVSTNHEAMDAFGIAPRSRFTMWDWVGGRYSLWSTVGLSIALSLGMDQFELMLAGGHEMDEHFRTAPLDSQPARADGPARRVEHRFPGPRFTRRPALRSPPASVPCVPAATRDGIERQERHA